ncbi:MAG: transposase [Kiritimatiellia bacterium]|jgi:REP element-mobilizing transposase RayT
MARGTADRGVNTAHRTRTAHGAEGGPVRPVHRAFQHSMLRRCFNHDYRDPFFYMITITTHQRRPWFGVCENNACTLSADGLLVRDLWYRIPHDTPQIELSTLCLMPDHLHGIVHVTEHMEKPVGVPLRAFKSQCTSALRKRHGDAALTLWNPGYNDRVVWRRGSLRAYRHYILDNPRRYCLKKAHPDLFRTVTGLQHAALPPDQRWDGYGNLFLLDRPEKLAIRVSRKASADEIAALREQTLTEAAQGTVIVSPFISPGEREIATAILDAPVGDVILLKPDGFPPLFKPNGRYFDLCVQGRLLILSRSVATVHGGATPLTRETCLALNAASAHIAEADTMEVIGNR